MNFHHIIDQGKTRSRKARVLRRRGIYFAAAFLLLAAFLAQSFPAEPVFADRFDEKIKALEQEISSYNKRAKELGEQADTLKNKISSLDNQQKSLQAEINLNNAKRDELKEKIRENESTIKSQSGALAKTLANIYYSQQTSSLDILMNSESVSDYVDATARQDALREQISGSVEKIRTAKAELEKQKEAVEGILRDQQGRKTQLAASQKEQQSLLDKTNGQEEVYQKLVKNNNSEIARLRAEQAAANARVVSTYHGNIVASGSGGGGYPNYLANAPQDSLVDPWGMYNRECVSYTAWKVHQAYGNMPYWGGRGNANQWDDNARAAGIPTGSTPKPGSVGVSNSGFYGHVVWVEKVSGNQIYISQYNYLINGQWGMYSEMWIDAGAYDTYIYFGER